MSLIKRMRKQKAIYWKRSAPDQYGHYSFEDPVEIACRWEKGSIEFRGPEGQALMFSSVVYVDRPMEIGDMLKRGDMESDVATDPTTDQDAFAIQRIAETPNLKATENLYIAYL